MLYSFTVTDSLSRNNKSTSRYQFTSYIVTVVCQLLINRYVMFCHVCYFASCL